MLLYYQIIYIITNTMLGTKFYSCSKRRIFMPLYLIQQEWYKWLNIGFFFVDTISSLS